METVGFLAAIFLTSILLPSAKYIWPLLIAPLRLCGIRGYMITDKTKVTMIRKGAKFSLLEEEDSMPLNIFVICNGVGFLSRQDAGKGEYTDCAYLFCTPATFEQATKPVQVNPFMKEIKSWNREGNYYWSKYHSSANAIKDYTLRPVQEELISKIQDYFIANGSCVAYIYGEMGGGKSTACRYLAERLDGAICKTFDPTEPGDTFGKLLRFASPDSKRPLIVIFDECAGMILRIRDERIERHKGSPIQVRDRAGWNSFLDDFGGGSFANCILLMTANQSPKTLLGHEEHFPMLRPGRVNLYFEMRADRLHTFDVLV
jgi:hypothetical protein